ncbi:MAG: STAS domain-containing protein [Acidiferrobacteraceae bacterium]|jgi:rsbT co-antagonist protein RsbR
MTPAQAEISINQFLIEQIKLKIGGMSDVVERRGHTIFVDTNLMSKDEITDMTLEFLELLVTLLQQDHPTDRSSPEFKALAQFITSVAGQIRVRGAHMEELVRYIMFIQRIFLEALEEDKGVSFSRARGALLLLASIFNETMLEVFHSYLKENERTITAQQEELKQISTPITSIWDGVLTLPIIGTLDSSRTMVVMERLLTRIEADRARAVVMDVTGVMTVDSQVSHHLIQMTRAIRLMGAQAILTGIRPDIARALTSLNIDLGDVTTRATLSDGLKEAFRLLNIHVSDGVA